MSFAYSFNLSLSFTKIHVFVKHYTPCGNKVKKKLFWQKVKVKVKRSLALVSFEWPLFMEYAYQIPYGSKVIAKVKVDNRQDKNNIPPIIRYGGISINPNMLPKSQKGGVCPSGHTSGEEKLLNAVSLTFCESLSHYYTIITSSYKM